MLLIIMVSITTTLGAQDCNLPACFDNDCGAVNVGFSPAGGVQFCENTPITFNNTSSTIDFNYFIVDWADGDQDTINNYNDLVHTYLIPDTALCEYPSGFIPFKVCFQGIKECGAGISCASGSYDFALNLRPRAIISGDLTLCEGEPVTLINTGCHAEEYLWSFSDGTSSTEASPSIIFANPGNYSVTLTVTNDCGSDTDVKSINVLGLPEADASISPIPIDDKICVGQILTFTDLANEWSNTTWQILPSGDQNWCFTDTTMNTNSDVISVEFKRDQEYTIRLLAENICGTDTWEQMIEVLDGPTVDLEDGPRECETLSYTPQVSYTGEIDSYQWTFTGGNPSSSTDPNPMDIIYNTPGTYDVLLVVQSACGDFTVMTDVIIDPNIDITITSPDEYCSGSSPDTLLVNVPGGVWSGPGIIDEDLGIFDPSTLAAGTYTITYTDESNSCNSSTTTDITINASISINTPDVEVCETDSTVQLNTDVAGGNWEGDFVTVDGVFNVSQAGVGSYTNTYLFTDENGCNISSTAQVDVISLPTLNVIDTVILCAAGGTVDLIDVSQFTASPSGGDIDIFIDGQMVNNPYNITLSEGEYELRIAYEAPPCMTTITSILSIISPPMLTVSRDTTVCINIGALQLDANLDGGNWTGPGIDNAGLIDLNVAGGAVHNYMYTIFQGTSCETSASVSVDVSDPTAGLSAGGDDQICENEFTNFTFSGFSPTGGVWSGEGITDAAQGTVDVGQLTIDSLYTYQYCVDDDAFEDCAACVSKTLIVRPLPVPDFDFEDGVCIGVPFTITNMSENATSYAWDFGDGGTSTQSNPSHQYDVSGNYTILLTTTSQYGCTRSTSVGIYVSEPPTVAFDVDVTEGCAPLPVTITNNSFGDDPQYIWIIDNDTLTIENPGTIILDGVTQDSIINITLTVANGCGDVSETTPILVRPYPIVKIDSDVDEGCSPLTVEFGNLTLGNPETYQWDMGNGNTYIDSLPPAQTYTTTDSMVSTYTVSLSSSNECGDGYGEFEITVFPPDVSAFVGVDTVSMCQYDSISPQSIVTPGSIITWSVFNAEGEFVQGSNEANPTFPLDDVGQHMIILNAARCGSDSDTAYVDVLPVPEVDFSMPPFICIVDTLYLSASLEGLSQIEWIIDNDTLLIGNENLYQFQTGGTHEVTMIGYSLINNCPNTITKQIDVIVPPVAGFTPNALSGCAPFVMEITNTTIGAENYLWTWGDSTSASMDINPEHTYEEPGTYTLQLTAYDAFGCSTDTSVVNVIVHKVPESVFQTDKNQYCQFYDSIYVTNLSEDITGAYWIIEDDTTDELQPVLYEEMIGVINIQLIVENEFGCMDISSQGVEILPSPIAEFAPSDTVECQPVTISFDNTSQQADSYVWSINGAESSSDEVLNFYFEMAGMQAIQLFAIAENGCPSDTFDLNVEILEKPVADFTFIKEAECGVPMNVAFSDNSTSDIIDYSWYFGNGESDQIKNPTTIYNSDQDYDVTLIVENSVGCHDTIEKTVPIWQQPMADFITSDTEICEMSSLNLVSESTFANTHSWEIDGSVYTDREVEIIIDEAGSYDVYLLVTYNNQCRDSLLISDHIKVYDSPMADFSFIPNTDPEIIGDVTFENESVDYSSIFWDLGDDNTSTEETFIHEYDVNRDLDVMLIAYQNNAGDFLCTDTIIKPIAPEWITTFFAPNAVSPDFGSEEVRLFTPKGIGIESYDISVYSPWGERVWYSEAVQDNMPSESWNGRKNNTGGDVSQGAYTWLANVTFVNGNIGVFKGTVTVLR